jgi:hypothetical protein
VLVLPMLHWAVVRKRVRVARVRGGQWGACRLGCLEGCREVVVSALGRRTVDRSAVGVHGRVMALGRWARCTVMLCAGVWVVLHRRTWRRGPSKVGPGRWRAGIVGGVRVLGMLGLRRRKGVVGIPCLLLRLKLGGVWIVAVVIVVMLRLVGLGGTMVSSGRCNNWIMVYLCWIARHGGRKRE